MMITDLLEARIPNFLSPLHSQSLQDRLANFPYHLALGAYTVR